MKHLRIIPLGPCWFAVNCLMLLLVDGLRAEDSSRVEPGQSATNSEINLLTRVFEVSANELLGAFESNDGANMRRAAPSNATSAKLLNDAVRFIFTSCGGLDFSPPKSIFYDETNQTLQVHSTARDLEDVEQVLETLKTRPPQMAISVHFYETSEIASTLGWLTALSATNWTGRHTRTFTETQSRAVFRMLEQRDGVKMVGTFAATTTSGRRIRVPSPPPSEPQDLMSITRVMGASDARPAQLGSTNPSVEVFPSGGIYNRAVQMYLNADIPGAIIERSPCILTPCTCSMPDRESHQYARDFSPRTIVESGQTYFFSVKFQKQGLAETSSKETNRMLIFITPTIIDAAGNRVQTDEAIPFSTNSVPKQPRK